MPFVDSHCHLDYADYEGELDRVIARARESGVRTMVTIGTALSRFDNVRSVAERFEHVYCTVGVHPHEAGTESPLDESQLLERADHPKVIGFGETGLDYFYDSSPRNLQRDCFRIHAAAARKTGLPLVVHTRDAEDDTIHILEEETAKGPFPGLIHCFSGTAKLAEAALALGFFISVSGIVTFKKADDLRAVLKTVPLDRLLVETDAPYLAPIPFRGKRNEPALVTHTANRLAELKGISVDQLGQITTDNFFSLFSKAKA